MWIYGFWAFITLLIVVGAFFPCDCTECRAFQIGDME